MRKLHLLWLLLFIVACAREDVIQTAEYGVTQALDQVTPVPVDAVIAEPDVYLDRTIAVEGSVHEVCQMAGCWLMIRAMDNAGGIRVHVERTEEGSYAFTVPTDISGRHAVAYGTIGLPDATHEAHYQEDAPHGAASLEMVATGVEITLEPAI